MNSFMNEFEVKKIDKSYLINIAGIKCNFNYLLETTTSGFQTADAGRIMLFNPS